MKRPQPWLMFVNDPGDGGGSTPPEPDDDGQQAKTFTQDEVNALVGQARTEERRKVTAKYADYDDLKARAEAGRTLEDRVAEIERQARDSEARALRAEVANAKGLTPSQAKRLIGATREELESDADELLRDIGDRKKQGNVAPGEGGNPNPGASDKDGLREFTRSLFANAAADES